MRGSPGELLKTNFYGNRHGGRDRPGKSFEIIPSDAHTSFWVLAGFLLLVFLTGGSSRADTAHLLLLRPISVLVLAYAVTTLRRHHILQHRELFIGASVLLGGVSLYLVPLPPSLWSALPGRDIIARIDAATGLGPIWRPLSMAPSATWNALFTLFIPLAVLLLGAQLRAHEHRYILVGLLAAGLASQFLSLFQMLGPSGGPLYLYRVTNDGAPVGFFANRNHFAVFIATLLPLLACYVTSPSKGVQPGRIFVCGLCALMAIVLLMISGSRAGLFVGLVALLSTGLIFVPSKRRRGHARSKKMTSWAAIVAVVVLFMLMLALILMSGQAASVQHVFASDPSGDPRSKIWPVIYQHLFDFFPFGSGVGTYEQTFKLIEPDSLLRSTYSNHAHNDWLELVWTTGVFGISIAVTALAALCFAAFQLFRLPRAGFLRQSRAGLTIMVLLLLGSVSDYPLRTPILEAVFVLACLWTSLGLKAPVTGGELARSPNDHRPRGVI